MTQLNKNITYVCEVWCSSTNMNSFKQWFLFLPLSINGTGLRPYIKRFTLLRSPLGNKRAKDQFERKEYRSYFYVEFKEASKLLAFIDVLRLSNGVRFKTIVRRKGVDPF
uniref:Ribosomal protein S10 n=1 Tax=Chorda asiatica TaxID=1281577 RepID=A0A8F0FCG8_9PHAE|nr:ribosomal protein S10 [Chorda asiatica]QWK44437.1 ribosomal protein S10 [Chorda asiatica]WBP69795.1 ribosomal protein S10 [Chorda asiatica]